MTQLRRSAANSSPSAGFNPVRIDRGCANQQLNRELYQAHQEIRRARSRQGKFEHAILHALVHLTTTLPTHTSVSFGPGTETPQVLAALDACLVFHDLTDRYHLYARGWAWSLSSTIIALDLFLDDSRWVQLDYGDPRKDVRDHFSGPPEMEQCGFSECLALPTSFTPDTRCQLQITDLEGHWRRFEITLPKQEPPPPPPPPTGLERLQRRLKRYTERKAKKRSDNQFLREITERVRTRFAAPGTQASPFTFLLPTNDQSAAAILPCVESLQRQLLDRWELVFLPCGSTASSVAAELRQQYKNDRRIRVLHDHRPVVARLNEAIAQARGEFVTLLEPHVQLPLDALAWLAFAVESHPNAAWLYSDGLHVDHAGNLIETDYKPDFSDLHLWSRFFTSGLNLYRVDAIRDVGGLRSEFGSRCESSQTHEKAPANEQSQIPEHNPAGKFCPALEYDLALRLSRRLPHERIVHVTESLFARHPATPHLANPAPAEQHAPEQTHPQPKQPPPHDQHAREQHALEQLERDQLALEQQILEQQILEQHFRTAGIAASVSPHPCGHGVRRIQFATRETPRVAIVIPTRDKSTLVKRCVASLRSATEYSNFQIVLVNNLSTEPELYDFIDENRDRSDFLCVDYPKPFNHSALHNEVLSQIDAEFVVLLNNDVCGFSAGWLKQLVATIQLDPKIAGVGTLLVYPDRRIQHAGVMLGVKGVGGHAHLDLASHLPGYQGRAHCLQDLCACTAACLLIRMSAYRAVGGFRPEQYPSGFNDVDLWLRLREAGYRCVYQPAVTAVHYESVSRDFTPEDVAAAEHLQHRLSSSGFRDPYFNPHLSLASERFRDLLPPAEARLAQWQRLVERLASS